MDPPDPRRITPDYLLAAVVIWGLILYGLLCPPDPQPVRMAARAPAACAR